MTDLDSLVRILVGPGQREFVVHRALLCASSPFFRDSIDAVPEALASPSSSPSSSSPADRTALIWLTGESADVFELFVLWLYRRHAFGAIVEDAVSMLAADDEDRPVELLAEDDEDDEGAASTASVHVSDLHWHLVRLHLFAALVDVPVLQDAVLDALQDLYLRFDWTATPALLRLLYAEADPVAAVRLRKWAVALLAWTLANDPDDPDDHGDDGDRLGLHEPLRAYPLLAAEFAAHAAKMRASGADARIKNPQLRIPSNRLRREDRHFGFRLCSFHSHRRLVGEGPCPHARAAKAAEAAARGVDAVHHAPDARRARSHRAAVCLPPARGMHAHAHAHTGSLSSLSSMSTVEYAPLGMESTV